MHGMRNFLKMLRKMDSRLTKCGETRYASGHPLRVTRCRLAVMSTRLSSMHFWKIGSGFLPDVRTISSFAVSRDASTPRTRSHLQSLFRLRSQWNAMPPTRHSPTADDVGCFCSFSASFCSPFEGAASEVEPGEAFGRLPTGLASPASFAAPPVAAPFPSSTTPFTSSSPISPSVSSGRPSEISSLSKALSSPSSPPLSPA
mmetsp:Transcript_8632/g.32485  ORF Transcript_8632/g.32485 Transcript_8632/m.32485 type:complete len:201 (+) Transcript_8632:1871-2473(+)